MTDLDDLKYDDDLFEYQRDAGEGELFNEQLLDGFSIDENFYAIFRAKVAAWAPNRWAPAERNAYRIGKQGREYARQGLHAPAVVWAATCVEIIFRDLTLKPIFNGLFLGRSWADDAVTAMFGNRWVRPDTRRKVAERVLSEVVQVDVASLRVGGIRPWIEIDWLLNKRNRVVHTGEEATAEEARRAVDIASALYGGLLPPLRELCGLTDQAGYEPPEHGAQV